jgi:cation diffusion facilitator family transporter
MATLSIGGLLLVVAWEILKTAVDRLFTGSHAEVTSLDFAVILITLVFNIGINLFQRWQGRRLKSDVMLAYAAETRADIFISLSVLIGLIGASFGLGWIDTVIALVIVLLILGTAYGILRKTTLVLTDAVAVNPADIERVVQGIPGIDRIIRVRSRGPANNIYADVDVQVKPATTTDHADALGKEIEDRVKAAFTGVTEVQVHFAPHHEGKEDRPLVARAVADALGLSVHEVTELLTAEGVVLEMHVEVAPTLTLAEAHRQVTTLENRLRDELPDLANVITHIEPASGQPGAILQTTRAISQRDLALKIAQNLYPEAHWHDSTIRPVMGGYAMTIHCWLPGTMSVQEAHAIAEHVETQIRAALPQVQRVTIHTEPPETDKETTKESQSIS